MGVVLPAFRTSVLLTIGLVLALAPAHAADRATLDRVLKRLSEAAAPWCGRTTELRIDGTRVCTVKAVVLEKETTVPTGAQFMGFVVITAAMLAAADEEQLAMVLGHEFAHLALGHAVFRVRNPGSDQERIPVRFHHLLEAHGNEPHPATPSARTAQELDADALGLLFAVRAGYSAAAAVELFARVLNAELERQYGLGPHHPPAAVRLRALQRLAFTLCGRVAKGEPLLIAEERLLPLEDFRREEALDATLPPARCDGVHAAWGSAP